MKDLRKTWTWDQERAAVVIWLRTGPDIAPPDAMLALADYIEQGEHVRALGELSAPARSPRRKRSAK